MREAGWVSTRERKRMLAYLIENVTLIKLPTEGTTKAHVRFRGTMILRWCCAAMEEAQARFRRVKGARSGMPILVAALTDNDRLLDSGVDTQARAA